MAGLGWPFVQGLPDLQYGLELPSGRELVNGCDQLVRSLVRRCLSDQG